MTTDALIFPSPEARETAIRRIQRFLNTRQDMFSLPQSLHVNGVLDEATCDALSRAAAYSQGWGEKAISADGTEESLATLDMRLSRGDYSYELKRLTDRYPAEGDAQKRRWWRSMQGLLEEKGVHFSQRYAPVAVIAKSYVDYQLASGDGRMIGWLESEKQELPLAIQRALAPVLAAMPGQRTANALLSPHQHTKPGLALSFAPTVVTYSFAVPDASMSESAYHRSADVMSPAAQQLLRDCMDEIEQVCGVKFVEIKPPLKAHFHAYTDEARSKSDTPTWAGMVPMRAPGQMVPVIFNEAVGQKMTSPDDARRVMLHELGHVLNLKHPHTPVNDFMRRMAKPVDNINHTAMSYFYLPHQPLADNPMGLDIEALQRQFGPPPIFTVPSRGYRIADDANAPVRRTLYDNDAALDWIDGSNQGAGVQIDLRPGLPQHSRLGTHRLWIALGSRIEGAIGGAGNDVLIAGAGESYLFGGAGRDQFEIHQPGHHRILDMKAEDSLVIGESLRKAGAVYTEMPWGVALRMGANDAGHGKATLNAAPLVRLDIATDAPELVAAKLKALLPQLKKISGLNLLPAADPRKGITMPQEAIELNGNQNPSHTAPAHAWPQENMLLMKKKALPWR